MFISIEYVKQQADTFYRAAALRGMVHRDVSWDISCRIHLWKKSGMQSLYFVKLQTWRGQMTEERTGNNRLSPGTCVYCEHRWTPVSPSPCHSHLAPPASWMWAEGEDRSRGGDSHLPHHGHCPQMSRDWIREARNALNSDPEQILPRSWCHSSVMWVSVGPTSFVLTGLGLWRDIFCFDSSAKFYPPNFWLLAPDGEAYPRLLTLLHIWSWPGSPVTWPGSWEWCKYKLWMWNVSRSVTCAADIATSVFIHPLICLFHLFRYFANFIDNKQFKKEGELLCWVLWRTPEMGRDSSPGLIWKLPGWPGLEVRHKLSVLALCFAAPRPCCSLFLDRSGAILTSVLVRPSIGLKCHFIHFL